MKFKVCVTQMVEQVGHFMIEADTAEAAVEKALDMDHGELYETCEQASTWGPGDWSDDAEVYAVLNDKDEEVYDWGDSMRANAH